MRLWLVLMAALCLATGASGAEERRELTPQERAEVQRLVALRDALTRRRGVVHLPEARATLNLGKAYYFLDAADSRRVLTEGWGNPPSATADVLGMVFKDGTEFFDDTWGAVVTYDETFFVKDDDAASADYDALLAQMREDEAKDNARRTSEGYPPMQLIGWAQPPTYDRVRHDLIWAREVKFGTDQDHTVNYDIRHLGRRGVLSMNLVSRMSELPSLRVEAVQVASTAEFDAGSRYADYESGDQVAGYGLAGLVAAGLGLGAAKKLGVLAIALVFLKKFAGVFIALAVGGLAWARRLFQRPG